MIPALNLGLKPVGLLAAGSCVSVLLFSGSAFTLVSNLISSFVSGSCACSEVSVLVIPALNLGLNPVGFGVEFVASSVFSSGTDVLAAASGALVTPALNLGLNPVGFGVELDSAESVISFLDVALTSSSTAVGGALNRGLKPAGFVAATPEVSGAISAITCFTIGFAMTVSSSARWKLFRSLLNQNFLLWSKLFSPIAE
ncbi:hypothetical protein D3C72_1350560 [compost metagenome]